MEPLMLPRGFAAALAALASVLLRAHDAKPEPGCNRLGRSTLSS